MASAGWQVGRSGERKRKWGRGQSGQPSSVPCPPGWLEKFCYYNSFSIVMVLHGNWLRGLVQSGWLLKRNNQWEAAEGKWDYEMTTPTLN